jgi:phage-related protein
MGWPEGVIAVWEDSDTDVKNGYVMSDNSSGGTWQHSPLTPAFGNEYYYHSGSNYNIIPTDPQTTLSSASAWTIEWRGWLPTKEGDTDSNHNVSYWTRGANNGGAGNLGMRILSNQWNPYGANMDIIIAGGQYYLGSFSGTNYNDGNPGNRWCRFTLTWDGNRQRLYFDGTLVWTSGTSFPNIFATSVTFSTYPFFYGNDYETNGMDRIIFATFDSGGTEISPISEPAITSLDVTSGTNDGGTEVVITGTGFVTGATVTFGGTAATGVSVDSATQITCTTPAHANGAVDVVVTNTDTGTDTLTNGFTYFSSPTITDITPSQGPHSATTNVTITGTEFAASPAVTFGGTTATSIVRVSATEITCVTPTGTTGDVDVVVTNTDTGSVTATDGYKYISVPTITDISPNFGDVAGGLLVTITGTEFATGAEVDFDGVPATDVSVNSATEIVCYTPGHVAEAVDVQVTNLDSGTVTETNGFTYHNPTMTLTGISPSTASALGGETLTLTGTLFAEGLDVVISGVNQLNVVVVNDETISFVTTEQAGQGIVDVSITDGVDTVTLPACLTFTAPPYWNAGTIFNKNKLASDGAVLLLLEVSIPGVEDTMRLVRNTENISWDSYTWQAFPFNIDDTNESSKGELPIVHVQISNITRIVQSYLEQTNGAAGAEIKIRYVHAQHLDDTTPLWIGTFALMQADCDENNITIQCGPKYSVNVRRPIWRNVKYICPWSYGGIICGAPAATLASFPTCDKSIVNCEERDNAARYGGELSIPGDYYG